MTRTATATPTVAGPVARLLLFGAGAAFMDRVGEGFIGREALRARA